MQRSNPKPSGSQAGLGALPASDSPGAGTHSRPPHTTPKPALPREKSSGTPLERPSPARSLQPSLEPFLQPRSRSPSQNCNPEDVTASKPVAAHSPELVSAVGVHVLALAQDGHLASRRVGRGGGWRERATGGGEGAVGPEQVRDVGVRRQRKGAQQYLQFEIFKIKFEILKTWIASTHQSEHVWVKIGSIVI